jgi:diaminobutyrate-2-oxoglutarate transaminase
MTNLYETYESNVRSYCRHIPVEFVSATGCTLQDAHGALYLDFLSGCSSLNFGHNDPDMKEALIGYMRNDGVAHGLDFHTRAKSEFIEKFQRLILRPRGLDYKLQFTGPTGTNAIEAAIKLARKKTGRTTIAAFSNGYHGMTMGALACTTNPYHRDKSFSSLLNGVVHLPYEGSLGDDVDTLEIIEKTFARKGSGFEPPAAFLIETIQGEGGINAASVQWLKGIERLARELGSVLIIDDIQAGVGRSGSFFSFEEAGLKPDLVTLAKSISGFGLPMALVLLKPEHDLWAPAEHNGTFRGNAHAMVTASVMLEKYWSTPEFVAALAEKSSLLRQRLNQFATYIPKSQVKGRGLMMGIDLVSGAVAERISKLCLDENLIIETSGPQEEVLKFLPPLTIDRSALLKGLSIVEKAVKQVSHETALAA